MVGDNCIIVSPVFNAWNTLTLDSTQATIGHLTCNGINDGSITISNTLLFAVGGSGGYDFAWSGPGGFSSTSQSISNLAPGSYTVLVTDRINASCNESASFVVNDRPAIVVTPRTSTNSTQMLCPVVDQLIPDAEQALSFVLPQNGQTNINKLADLRNTAEDLVDAVDDVTNTLGIG